MNKTKSKWNKQVIAQTSLVLLAIVLGIFSLMELIGVISTNKISPNIITALSIVVSVIIIISVINNNKEFFKED